MLHIYCEIKKTENKKNMFVNFEDYGVGAAAIKGAAKLPAAIIPRPTGVRPGITVTTPPTTFEVTQTPKATRGPPLTGKNAAKITRIVKMNCIAFILGKMEMLLKVGYFVY